MILRRLLLLLLAANLAWWAWAQGWMRPWGIGPVQQQEPHRLERQIQPAALRVLSASEAAGVAMASAPGAVCLVSPPLDEAVVSALRRPLAAWPPGSWSLDPAVEVGRWVVYMGKYPDAPALERKKAELRARGVAFEPLANPALEPGLSLGGFPTQDEAQDQLKALSERGVRTARVVQERPDLRGTALRLPALDDSLRPRLADLQPLLAGQLLRPCR
jgi:hypothetical protein